MEAFPRRIEIRCLVNDGVDDTQVVDACGSVRVEAQGEGGISDGLGLAIVVKDGPCSAQVDAVVDDVGVGERAGDSDREGCARVDEAGPWGDGTPGSRDGLVGGVFGAPVGAGSSSQMGASSRPARVGASGILRAMVRARVEALAMVVGTVAR